MSSSLTVWWNKQTDTYIRITFSCYSLAHKQDSFPQNVHSQATMEMAEIEGQLIGPTTSTGRILVRYTLILTRGISVKSPFVHSRFSKTT